MRWRLVALEGRKSELAEDILRRRQVNAASKRFRIVYSTPPLVGLLENAAQDRRATGVPTVKGDNDLRGYQLPKDRIEFG